MSLLHLGKLRGQSGIIVSDHTHIILLQGVTFKSTFYKRAPVISDDVKNCVEQSPILR